MAKITIERAHNLGHAEARERADKMVRKLSDKLGLAHEWEGDTVKLEGKGAKGQVDVQEALILVTIELGFMLSAMSPMIKTEIERVLDKALAA